MGISHLAYRVFKGKSIYNIALKNLSWLDPYLTYSGFKISLRRYVATIVFVTILSFPLSLPLTYVFHAYILGINVLFSIVASIILSLIVSTLILALLIYLPVFKAKSKLELLETRLPYIVSYMAVLSYAGRNMESIIAKLAEKGKLFGIEEPAIRMLRRIFILGQDTARMLMDEARKTPSVVFSSLLESLAGIVETGKGLNEFLESEFMYLLRNREAKVKEVMNSMAVLMEVFISLVVVMPLVLTIMLSIMASLGAIALPISPLRILFLVHFIIAPTIAVMIVLMIDSLVSKVSG